MRTAQGTLVLWAAGPALALWALAGLVVRHKLSHAYCLSPFLAALIASAILPAIAPTSYDWGLWLLTETIHTVLAFALGLELAWRLFRNLQGAALVARRVSRGTGAGPRVLDRSGGVSAAWARACARAHSARAPSSLESPVFRAHPALFACYPSGSENQANRARNRSRCYPGVTPRRFRR